MLDHIREQLAMRHRSRYDIMSTSIKDRLDKSLQTYEQELSLGVEYISQKSETNVLKKL